MIFIHTKTVSSIFLILIIVLFRFLSGCYTQLDITLFDISKSRNNPFQSEFIDPNILGSWEKTIYWVDSPDQVQQIILDTNHNLLFEEYLGSNYGDKLSGSFRTKDSILTIVLDYGYGTEKYYYKVTDEKLTLIPIDMNKYFPYKVSGSGGWIWINPYF